MKTKFVVLLATLATAALLLIAGFVILSTVVEFTNPPVVVGACEDAYEPDNDYTTATTVTVPSLTSHNFDNADDKDWVVFSGTAGITYTIKTMNLAVSGTRQVDTKLFFYWWDGSDLVQLDFDADGGDEKWASKIVWPITTTGWYYVHVGHIVHSLSFWGCDATYDLSIIRTGVPCTMTLVIEPDTLLVGGTATMTATVVDCSGSPLAGQVITFSTTSDLGSGGISPVTATTNADGQAVSYISSTITGVKLVTATAPNLVAGTDTVTFTEEPSGCEDAYEPDNIWSQATLVTPPSITHHNFDVAYDTDWVVFSGTAGITYTIETMNLAVSGTQKVDTKLVFYWWDGSDLVWLDDDDDGGDELWASKIVWPITTTGWYYVNVGHVEGAWSFSGCDAYYDLRITGPPAHVYLPIILKSHPPPPSTPTPTATTPPSTPGPPPPGPGDCYPRVERTIPVGNDPRGVAYNGDDNLIYVANYGDDTVSVINGETYDVTKVITGVVGANGVAYDSNHGLVYVTNQSIGMLTVISATTNTIVETTPVGDKPNGVAYNPTVNKIYVANYGGNSVTVLDGDTRALITTVTVPGETEPAHIAVNPVTNKAYVAYHGSGKVGAIDGGTNDIHIIDIYSAGPYGITVDTVRHLIYVATIDSHRIVAIDGVSDTYLGWAEFHKDQDPAQPAPLRVIAVNPNLGASGHLYATTVAGDGGFDRFFAIPKGWDEDFHRPYAIDVGNSPREGIAVNLSNNRVYVTARGSNRLTILEDGEPPCLWNFAMDFTVTLCRVGIDGDCR
jgi:YVTN family beta-propeller protein